MKELLDLSCTGLKYIPCRSGKNGYKDSIQILKNNRELGFIAHGSDSNIAQNEKPQIQINGDGKTDEISWEAFHYWATRLDNPSIKRIDLAKDVFDGSLSIETVREAHLKGGFTCSKAPKAPLIMPIGEIQPDGSNPGRSLYIGSMKSPKFVRFYEKGHESYKQIIASENDSEAKSLILKMLANHEETTIEHVNGGNPFVLSKWVRAELQLRDTNCDIPLDILVTPDYYFSGAYPFLKDLLEMNDGKVSPRLKTHDELNLMVRIKNIQAIAGSLIDDLTILGWNNDEIVEALKGGKGASQKLIRSGAYKES